MFRSSVSDIKIYTVKVNDYLTPTPIFPPLFKYRELLNFPYTTFVSNSIKISRNFKLLYIRNGFQIRIPRPK